MKTLCLFVLSLGFLVACQSVRIEKRLHSRGYAFFWNKKISKVENNADVLVLEEDKTVSKVPETNAESAAVIQSDTFNKSTENPQFNKTPSPEAFNSNAISSEAQGSGLASTTENLHSNDSKTLEEKSEESHHKWLLFALAFPVLGAAIFRKRSKERAHWAKNNKHRAQMAIAGLSVASASASYFLGAFYSSYHLPELLPLSVGILGTSAALYASKNTKTKQMGTVALSASSSLLLFSLGTMDEPIYVEDTRILPLWLSITLTVLIVALVLYATAIVAALSCTIWCMTAQALPALLVAGVGGYIVFTLGFWGIFSLYKWESQRDESFFLKAALWGLFGLLIIGWLAFVVLDNNYY